MTCANERERAEPGSALLIYAEGLISEDQAKGIWESWFPSKLSILALPIRLGGVEWLLRDPFQP